MTSFPDSFFEEEEKEIRSWSERGYVEIHRFLSSTEYTFDDLILVGVVERKFVKTIPGTGHGLNGEYPPNADWKDEFRRGEYFTWYIRKQTMDSILEMLNNNVEVKNQVIERINERAIRDKEYLNSIENKDKYLQQHCDNQDLVSKNGSKNNYEGEKISENLVAAVVSMTILLGVAYIALPGIFTGRFNSLVVLIIFSVLSYSPFRFVIKDGNDRVFENIKALFYCLVIVVFIGIFLSKCAGGGEGSCYYRVGCL